jgi:hypothetical protein
MMAGEPSFGPDSPMQQPHDILGKRPRVVGMRVALPFQRRDHIEEFLPRRRSGPGEGRHTVRRPRVS